MAGSEAAPPGAGGRRRFWRAVTAWGRAVAPLIAAHPFHDPPDEPGCRRTGPPQAPGGRG